MSLAAPRPPLPELGLAQGRDAESPPRGQRDGVCCRRPSGQRRLLPCASPSLPGALLVLGRVWWRLKEEESVTLFQAAVSPCHVGKMLGAAGKGPGALSVPRHLQPLTRRRDRSLEATGAATRASASAGSSSADAFEMKTLPLPLHLHLTFGKAEAQLPGAFRLS